MNRLKRKLLIALALTCGRLLLPAQVSPHGTFVEVAGARGVTHLYLFADLSQADITYTGSQSPVNYYDITALTQPPTAALRGTPVSSGSDYFAALEDGHTYLLLAGTDSITFAVMDYAQYATVFQTLVPDASQEDHCTTTLLTATGQISPLTYQTPYGPQTIAHEFRLRWNTLTWSDSSHSWEEIQQQQDISATSMPLNIQLNSAPLCDTYFTLLDTYADSLNLTDTIRSDNMYIAVAVAAHVTTVTVARTETNEVNRPDSAALQGSGPVEIEFRANPTPAVRFYEWKIMKSTDLMAQRSDENHRYTFNESGSYTVSLTFSNVVCSDSASSVSVTVNESILDVPNVFTPNGDGVNDEFRVAYRSLRSFTCSIYNRWGRLVHRWDDPSKGWDGTINGHKAAPGTYFYVIRAVGSDGQKYKRSGDINLIGR